MGDNATILLGEDSEPQPDLYVRILPECGGQSRTTAADDVAGAPTRRPAAFRRPR